VLVARIGAVVLRLVSRIIVRIEQARVDPGPVQDAKDDSVLRLIVRIVQTVEQESDSISVHSKPPKALERAAQHGTVL
jgi:hypothetical protein